VERRYFETRGFEVHAAALPGRDSTGRRCWRRRASRSATRWPSAPTTGASAAVIHSMGGLLAQKIAARRGAVGCHSESDMAARSKSCPPVRAAATNPWRAGFLPSERMLREVPLSTLSAVGRLVHPCQRRGGGLSVPLRRRATGPRYGAMDLTADREALPRRASGALQAPARDHRRVGRRRSCTARPRMVDETLNLPD